MCGGEWDAPITSHPTVQLLLHLLSNKLVPHLLHMTTESRFHLWIAMEGVARSLEHCLPSACLCLAMQVVVLWQQGAAINEFFDPGLGATVRVFGSEKAMLTAWLEVVKQYDPDALVTFQVPYSGPRLLKAWQRARHTTLIHRHILRNE
jgi:DNA polymerase elongation subunit (family B)